MADFDLTQTDAQVQSILNDAQNAQGAGAQTTLTTDYIMLKDTSGNYHKILKDSFTEACRNVLAGLLVNNDKGTTISQIPAIASGDFGSVTPANLASVLGAPQLLSIGSGYTSLTINKGLKQAIFYCTLNGGTRVSSIFVLGRTSVGATLNQGDVTTSMFSIDSVTGDITVTKASSQIFYYRLMLME